MKWVDSKIIPPSKEFVILAVCEFSDFPITLKWIENGTYGEPAFFEEGEEYSTKEESILFWMPCPLQPERSKREDSENGAKCDFGLLKSEMRCSEHDSNAVREVR